MIESIRHKGLKLFYERGDASKVTPSHVKRLRLILTLLAAAESIEDLNFPLFRFTLIKR